MAKSTPKSILFDTYTAGIFGRTEGYANRVRQLYAQAVTELLKLAASQGVSEDEMFEFDKLPKKLREEANKILRLLYTSVYNEVQHGIRAEWEYANLSNDIIIKRIFGDAVFKNEGNHFARWFGRNQQAMDAFLRRRTGKERLGLSERIWNYTEQLKDEMELALSVSMGQGESASAVSRKVRQYLQEPDRLFRHVKGKDGKMRWSKAAKAYLKEHDVGRGQYLSSYKNAMRLTRTETNMAYRASDYERWQQLDFVLGIHIQRAHREDNDKDICELLQGDYPKTFKFTGWHPQCRCIATPILATPDEMIAMRKAMKEGKDPRSVLAPGRYITEPPAAFTQWIDDNRERIENAASVPYFIRDNYKDGDIDKGFAWVKTKKEKTQEEKQAILEKWNERKRHNTLITKMGNNVYNVAAGYPDVDTADLVAAINSGNITKIEEQARAVAKQVAALNKQLRDMESLIDNPKQWLAQGVKVSELQTVCDKVQEKIANLTNKYSSDSWLQNKYGSLDKFLLDKLHWEAYDYLEANMGGVQDKYPNTWKISQSAYIKQHDAIQEKLVWQDIQAQSATLSAKLSNGLYAAQIAKLDHAITNKQKDAAQNALADLQAWSDVNDVLQEALTFQTKSQPYLNLIAQLKQNISSDNLTEALNTVLLMKQKRNELAKAAGARAAKRFAKMGGKALYDTGDLPFTAKELEERQKMEEDIIKCIMGGGDRLDERVEKYHDYILRLSEKYYSKQVSVFTDEERIALKDSTDRFLRRTPSNPHYIWGATLGGTYDNGYHSKIRSYLPSLNGLTLEELTIVQRFTNGSTFSNCYNLRKSSPYWRQRFTDKLRATGMGLSEIREQYEMIEEWSQGANYVLDRMVRYQGITFRGLDSGGGPELRKQLKQAYSSGKPWVNDGSCSTSMKHSVARSFNGDLIIIIHNKTGAYIHKISEYSREFEIMTLRGAKYKVLTPPTKVGSRYYCELEEII